jgi:hypothetical protein
MTGWPVSNKMIEEREAGNGWPQALEPPHG